MLYLNANQGSNMLRTIRRLTPRDLLRWALFGLLLALMLSVAPEYWSAERLPRELQYVRALTIVVPLVLSILLYRARHESPLRQFPLLAGLSAAMMCEPALKLGLNGRVTALLVVWAVVILVEWRRLVEEERQLA